MQVHAKQRPMVLTFEATGSAYPISSDEAQTLIDQYPVLKASSNRVILRADDGHKTIISPATLGGGNAFEIVK